MERLDRRIVLLTTLLAACTALLIAVVLPVTYYYFGYRYHAGYIAAEVRAQRRVIEVMIAADPQGWSTASKSVDNALQMTEEEQSEADTACADRRLIFTADGRLVSEYIDSPDLPLVQPIVRASIDLQHGGAPAGRIVIERSLRPLLWRSLGVAFASAILGLTVFIALRTLPLRALQRCWQQSMFLASHDVLTSLPNRALFMKLLDRALALARRQRTPLAVLCLDLDRFKDVNDTLGHGAGDRLLQQVSARILGCIRDADTLARLGGDEFVILQTEADQPDAASTMARRIIEQLGQPFDLDGHEVVIGVSIGVALYTDPQQTPATMMRDADLSLYRAKAQGRGTFCFFEEEMNARLELRKRTEHELRLSMVRGEFELHYQPQYDLDSEQLTGVEALLRWRHPRRGLLSPDQFVPLAEETGLIYPLGEWVLHTACTEAARWPALTVAVNLSPVQFRRPGLERTVAQILCETGLPPARLELEVTERMLQDTESTLAQLQALKAVGVRVALDDFGSGYSSLGHLRRFPFDKVKIDRSFICGASGKPSSPAIVRSVVRLAHALGMTAAAEGCENRSQLQQLRAEGCDSVQGFLLGRPMRAGDIARLVGVRTASAQPPAA